MKDGTRGGSPLAPLTWKGPSAAAAHTAHCSARAPTGVGTRARPGEAPGGGEARERTLAGMDASLVDADEHDCVHGAGRLGADGWLGWLDGWMNWGLAAWHGQGHGRRLASLRACIASRPSMGAGCASSAARLPPRKGWMPRVRLAGWLAGGDGRMDGRMPWLWPWPSWCLTPVGQ